MPRSAIPPTSPDDASCFEQAQQAGRLAAQQLAELAPLSERQRAWLSGFFAGLLDESGGAPRQSRVSRGDSDASPPGSVRAVPNGSYFDRTASNSTGTNCAPLTTAAVSSASAVVHPSTAPADSPAGAAHNIDPGPAGPVAAFHPAETTVQLRAALATGAKGGGLVAEETPAKYSADNPFAARIAQLSPGQTRNPVTWRLTLDVEGSGLRCRPGDQLGVVPSNDPDLVRKLLRRLGAKGQENVSTARGTGPAWRALLEEFNISTVTQEMLRLLSGTARNPHEATQLEGLSTSPHPFVTTLPALLRRFPSAKPAFNDFVNCLSPLLPQYFPLATARSRHADSLEALVVHAQHETRSVVTQLASEKLGIGDWLPIFVDSRSAGHPPAEIDAPAILLAPGAGSACAYAFLAERAATRGSGRNWLFTSPAPGEPAIPYAEQFAAWQTSRVLTRLDIADSNELGRRFLDQAEMVQAWVVDGSYVYLYANARTCAQLESALAELLVARARISSDEAYTRLAAMRVSGQLRVVTTE